MTTTRTMPIGQFSRLTRLSVRMLRHYDAHGVLVPADVDEWSGHRRYEPRQIADAAAVRTLRDAGFGVEDMARLLAVRETPAWQEALAVQRERLLGELAAARERLALVERLLAPEPTTGGTMSITVERRTVPAMTVVALRGTVPGYGDESLLWQRMMPLVAAQGIIPAGPCGVIEHDEEFTEHDVDLSVFLPVARGTRVEEPLELLELPARDCLVAHVLGSYRQISRAHDLVGERIAAEQLSLPTQGSLAGKVFNLYLATPDEVSEEHLVTDVHQPLG